MNLDSINGALSHISNLVGNLTKKNFNSSLQEIKEVLLSFGGEAEQHLYRVVLKHFEWLGSSSESRISLGTNSPAVTNGGVASLCVITTEKDKDLASTSNNPSYLGFTSSNSNSATLILLIQQIAAFIPLHRFANCFAVAISTPFNHSKLIRQGWVSAICKLLKLSKVQEVVICIQLLHSSVAEIRNQATVILKSKLQDLIRSYIEAENSGQELSELSTETFHLVLTHSAFIKKDSSFPILLNTDQIVELISVLQKEFSQFLPPLVLSPIIYPDTDTSKELLDLEGSIKMAKNLLDGSLADIVKEIGCNFCSSFEECKTNLIAYGPPSITPRSVARTIGYMAISVGGLQMDQICLQNLNDQSTLWSEKEKPIIQASRTSKLTADSILQGPISSVWNVDAFIKALLDVVPSLNEKEVIAELDYSGFYIRDKPSLTLLFKALRLLLHGQGHRMVNFPTEYLYQKWNNTDEQLLLITQILNNNDIFCFTDYSCPLTLTDGLKSVPEPESKDLYVWKSIPLTELLMTLAENDHYSAVLELLKFPMQHCPDVLMLTLTQISVSRSSLRLEIFSNLIPMYLGPNPNTSIILHSVWNIAKDTHNVQRILMMSMSDWYMMMEYDQTKLSRILDIAQDLKALPNLLNAQPFAFIIDLACLAYRREYLKLDKWLPDKVKEHGESFVNACVLFLQHRCPQLVGKKEDPKTPQSSQLPKDTISTMVSCLHSISCPLSQEFSDTILTMVQNCSLLARPKQMSLLGFPGQGDAISNLASNLGNLAIGGGSTASTIFPNSTSMNINVNAMGAIGSNIPLSSPARPLPTTTQVASSQQQTSLQSIMPSLPLPVTSVPSILESPQPTTTSSAITPFTLAGDSRKALGALQLNKILELPSVMPKEAESEANSYFQKIYNLPPNPTLSVEEALEMLGKFQHSKQKREKMVYLCMLKNLFEEYRYFPSYPLRELILTARLFGGMIDQGFVEFIALGIALRFVMEAIMNPCGSYMYYFGIVALDRFRKKMKDYPRYCLHITTSVEHFNQFPSHIIEYLNYGAKGILPPVELSGECLPPNLQIASGDTWSTEGNSSSLAAAKTSVALSIAEGEIAVRSVGITQGPAKPSMTQTNIETLLDATEEKKITPPPENLAEKIAFIFNNLSQMNLSQKCEELKEDLIDEYWEWLAQYMVMKRASIEHNFHTLYALFLDQLRLPPFNNLVVQETLRNVKVLLRADKSMANLSDKSLLKNLGHWLGMLTLAKSKPILHIDIDIKSLLVEAYKKGLQEMQYVVPFVAKVMECCSKSKVFKPPNPWTMAIMNVLAELHGEQDMKLHLKFEIEVLCNKLEILLKDLKPSNTLKNPEKLAKITTQLSPSGDTKRAESTPIMPALQDWHLGQERRLSAASAKPVPKEFSQTTKENVLCAQSASAGATPTSPVIPSVNTSLTPPPVPTLPQNAVECRFSYKDLNINSLRCIDAHLTLSTQHHGIENGSQMKQILKLGIDTSIQELTSAVVERSIKVAMTTTENLIKKDFALEPDERKMRIATHHLVRNLTAAHVLMTAKEHVVLTIAKYVKQNLLQSFSRPSPIHTEQVETYSNNIAQEYSGMVCAYMQKSSAEKAVLEMDKIFTSLYDSKKVARSEGKRHYDARVYAYQMDRIAEPVRMKVGGITAAQMLVYQEFGRNIPGFLPRMDNEIQEDFFLQKPIPTPPREETNTNFHVYTEKILLEIDQLIVALTSMQPSSPLIPLVHSLQEGILMCRSNGDNTADQLLIRRCVENLLEAARDQQLHQEAPELQQLFVRFRDMHLVTLKAVADMRSIGAPWTSKFVSKCWMESREDNRYNLDAFDWLLKTGVINIPLVDDHLSRCIEEYHPHLHLHPQYNFIVRLIQNYLVETTSTGLTEADLPVTLDKLLAICQTQNQVDSILTNTMEALKFKHDLMTGGERITANILDSLNPRNNSVQNSCSQHFTSGVNQAKDFQDPPGLQDKTEIIFRHWTKLFHAVDCCQPGQAFQIIVKEMDVHGILKTDELITRFFRISLTLCRDICIRSLLEGVNNGTATQIRNKCFPHVDAFVRLIASLVKQSGEPSNPTAKINLLNKVLGLICGIMLHDIESSGGEFHQLPYHRLLIMLFLDLNAPETVLEAINLPVLMAFTQTLHLLRPSKCPGFAYAWLEIVSHRVLIGRMLAITPAQKGWAMYSMLLTDLFKFLAPFLRNVELSKPFTTLYKGTLRVLLVLLHDFPEFLCEFHFIFCDNIPPNCIQMRNLILSAYPRKMRLPDPFMPNLRVDRLPEITVPPKMHTAPSQILPAGEFKDNIDEYLKHRSPVGFLSTIRSLLQHGTEPSVSRYNVQMLNALILYVGTQAIEHITNAGQTPSMVTISHTSHMDVFENLSVDLDTEGRYLFLVAIANQLRYPNSHTHYYSCALLYLFSEAHEESIQEQITRVLLERLIGNRPQPWGLLITFIELLKNPAFKFWSHNFVKCAPEIEKIFESVARSCCVTKAVQQE